MALQSCATRRPRHPGVDAGAGEIRREQSVGADYDGVLRLFVGACAQATVAPFGDPGREHARSYIFTGAGAALRVTCTISHTSSANPSTGISSGNNAIARIGTTTSAAKPMPNRANMPPNIAPKAPSITPKNPKTSLNNPPISAAMSQNAPTKTTSTSNPSSIIESLLIMQPLCRDSLLRSSMIAEIKMRSSSPSVSNCALFQNTGKHD